MCASISCEFVWRVSARMNYIPKYLHDLIIVTKILDPVMGICMCWSTGVSVKGVESLTMSLLQYFVKAKVVPTPEETEIREKPTVEVNICVAEVLKLQQLDHSPCKHMATVHSEGQGKIGKYASINVTALFVSTSNCTKRCLCVLNMIILATSLPIHWRSKDNHLYWEKAWTPKSRITYVHFD